VRLALRVFCTLLRSLSVQSRSLALKELVIALDEGVGHDMLLEDRGPKAGDAEDSEPVDTLPITSFVSI
jgi:hypothetical protein